MKNKYSRPVSKQKKPHNAWLAHEGKVFNVWQWKQKISEEKTVIFEGLERPDTVLILPVTSNNEIILAHESQPGMPLMLRTLGWRVEHGETAEEAARRELLEESGYTAEKLLLWDAWQPVNKIDWAVYLFIARNLSKQGEQNLDEGEKIDLYNIEINDFLDPNSKIKINDYELLYKLNYARANETENARIKSLLYDEFFLKT